VKRKKKAKRRRSTKSKRKVIVCAIDTDLSNREIETAGAMGMFRLLDGEVIPMRHVQVYDVDKLPREGGDG